MSQFTIYTSSDSGAPSLNGNVGSLINVLDGCLVTGYGSKSPPSPAWTKPAATISNITSYKQPAGAGLGLVINDNGSNATSLGEEAWATGWETVTSVTGPVGGGTNQFPTAAQLLTTGHTVIRKSVATGATTRSWVVFADSYTFYLFVLTGDSANVYYSFGFGDIYSIKNSTDAYRCVILGRSTENSAASTSEGFDLFSALNTAVTGNFMARTYAGTGTSITVGKHGDSTKGSAATYLGTVQYPNGEDADVYISPVWVCENGTPNIRGRLRGLYQPLHAISNFTDGQTFTGTGDYAGKTFQAVKQSANSGVFLVETSNTLDTN